MPNLKRLKALANLNEFIQISMQPENAERLFHWLLNDSQEFDRLVDHTVTLF